MKETDLKYFKKRRIRAIIMAALDILDAADGMIQAENEQNSTGYDWWKEKLEDSAMSMAEMQKLLLSLQTENTEERAGDSLYIRD